MDPELLTKTFDYIAFFIIYIYCFVYLNYENTEVTSFGLLLLVHSIFMIFIAFALDKYYQQSLVFSGMLALSSIGISTIFHFVALIFITMLLYKLKYKFKQIRNEGIHLPPDKEKELELFKKLMIATFCLGVIMIFSCINFFPIINLHFDISNLLGFKNMILYFFTALSLSMLVISSYQVYLGNSFLEYSRKECIHMDNDILK